MSGQANRIEIEARLARSELKFTANGVPSLKGSLAYTPRKLDKVTEQWVDGDTMWFKVEAWRKTAELMALLPKGTLVQVFGQLKIDYWVGPENERKEKTYILVDRFCIPVFSEKSFRVDEDDNLIMMRGKKKAAPVNNGIENIAADYSEEPY